MLQGRQHVCSRFRLSPSFFISLLSTYYGARHRVPGNMHVVVFYARPGKGCTAPLRLLPAELILEWFRPGYTAPGTSRCSMTGATQRGQVRRDGR